MKNFRIIGDVTIDFGESPIIALTGDNESGKTSIVKAFIVAGMNGLLTKQKSFIKEGTKGFGIQIKLEDGTEITRLKTATSNRLVVEKPGQPVWEASKIDRGMGIPVELQQVMGLIEEPETKEYLQVRTYEDQLLFVVTSGSTNYKVMYDALKVDQLTRALKLGTEEANTLKRSLDNNSFLISELMTNIRQIRTVDIEPLVNVKDRLAKQLRLLDKLERAVGLQREIKYAEESMSTINQLMQLEEIDEQKVVTLVNAKRAYDELTDAERKQGIYSNLNKLEEIELVAIDKMKQALNFLSENKAIEVNAGTYAELEKAEEIDEVLPVKLERALRIISERQVLEESYNIYEKGLITGENIATEITNEAVNRVSKIAQVIGLRNEVYNEYNSLLGYQKEMERLTDLLKQSGAVVADCPKCGETVIVDART